MSDASSDRWVYIEVDRIKWETEKAFLCVRGDEEFWIPKTQVADYEDYEEGDEDVGMSVTRWIATEKGL